jgi:plastocyanin
MRVCVGLAGSMALVLSACGGGGGGPTVDASVASVVVTPSGTQTLNQGNTLTLTASARNASNQIVGGQVITWTTADVSKASLSATTGSTVTVTGVAVGSSLISASSAGKTAQVTVNVTAPGTIGLTATVNTPGTSFDPAVVDILAGGTVTWNIAGGHNVTFGTAGSPSNIPTCTTCSESRSFPTAGTFVYSCTLHAGMNGSVVVH